eukprot:7328048-Pyramimonas_sp.AAC.1
MCIRDSASASRRFRRRRHARVHRQRLVPPQHYVGGDAAPRVRDLQTGGDLLGREAVRDGHYGTPGQHYAE